MIHVQLLISIFRHSGSSCDYSMVVNSSQYCSSSGHALYAGPRAQSLVINKIIKSLGFGKNTNEVDCMTKVRIFSLPSFYYHPGS